MGLIYKVASYVVAEGETAEYREAKSALEASGARVSEVDSQGERVLLREDYHGAVVREFVRQGHWQEFDMAEVYDAETGALKEVQVGHYSRSMGMGSRSVWAVTEVGKLSPGVEAAVSALQKDTRDAKRLEHRQRYIKEWADAQMHPQKGDSVRYVGRKTKRCKPGDSGIIFWVQGDRIGFKPDPDDKEAQAYWCNATTPSGAMNIAFDDDVIQKRRESADPTLLIELKQFMPEHPLVKDISEIIHLHPRVEALSQRFNLKLTHTGVGRVEVNLQALLETLERFSR